MNNSCKITCPSPHKFSNKKVNSLQNSLSLSRPIIQILLHRGFESVEEIKGFLSPSLGDLIDPFLFKDMEKAVDRIGRALKEGEPILIYGDYDVDGVSSIALLVRNFLKLNRNILYYIPDRIKEGYGISNPLF